MSRVSRRIRSFILLALSALMILVMPGQSFAGNPSQATLNFYGMNGIYYYNPAGTTPGCTTTYSLDLSDITIIGDSLIGDNTHGVRPYLKKQLQDNSDEIIYAAGNHFMTEGIDKLKELKDSGQLRKNIIYALGTDDVNTSTDPPTSTITQADIDKVLDTIGTGHTVYFVTNYVIAATNDAGEVLNTATNFSASNALLKQAAQSHSDVYIIDYASLMSGNPQYFSNNEYKDVLGLNDGIHLNADGYTAYAKLIGDVIKAHSGEATTICGCVIAAGSYDGSTSAGLTSTQAGFVDTYHDIAAQLSVEYGIPWEAVMAQGILESDAGTSHFATTRNNFFGLGARDENPDEAYRYDNPMAGWRGYYDFIKNNSRYRNHGVFQEPNITDPYSYLQTIKNAGYATDPNYISKVSGFITAVINRANEKGWKLSSQLAAENPIMLSNASANSAGSTNGNTTNTSYVNSFCIINGSASGAEQDNGDINATAISLAWPDRTHDKSDPKEEYKIAQQAVGMWGSQDENDCSIYLGASCDRFVATVILYSGVDPNFPRGTGVDNIMSYLQRSSLFREVPNTGNSSSLQPGDILVRHSTSNRRGHIQIYVRKDDGTFGIASASYCDRTADIASASSSISSDYHIFRYVGRI